MIYPNVKRLYSIICVLLTGIFKDCCVYGTTCYYLHTQQYSFHNQYCADGCCSGYGQGVDICCVAESWPLSTIVGISVGCVVLVIILVAICVKIWLSLKNKNKQGVGPQINDNASVQLHLNSSPMGSCQTLNVSHHENDLPPPYTPTSRASTRLSQTSPIELSVVGDPQQIRKLSPQPPPYTSTAQTLRPSPRAGGRLSPRVYNFQPSPSRNLAPSRAW